MSNEQNPPQTEIPTPLADVVDIRSRMGAPAATRPVGAETGQPLIASYDSLPMPTHKPGFFKRIIDKGLSTDGRRGFHAE